MIRTHYRDFAIPWPGKQLDPEFTCHPLVKPFGHVAGGRLFCFYPPVFPFVSSLPYRVWGMTGLFIAPLVAGLALLPGVWILGSFLPGRRLAQPLAIALVALATPVWFYSMTFWEHTLAACLTTWSTVFLVRSIVRCDLLQLAVSAALCGLAVYFRDDVYVFAASLLVVSVLFVRQRRWQRAAVFCVALLLSLIPLWWLQWSVLAHPLGHHLTHTTPLESGLGRHLLERIAVIRALLLNAHRRLPVSVLLSLPFIAAWLIYPRVSKRTYRWLVPLLGAIGAVSGLVILAGHMSAFSPMWWLITSNSLFAVSPVLILAFVRCQDRPEQGGQTELDSPARIRRALWLLATLHVLIVVVVLPEANTGGIHWGCRLVLTVYPLLGVLAASTLAVWWGVCRHGLKIGAVVLGFSVGLSIVTQVYSLRLLSRQKSFSARLNQAVRERPEDVVITSHGLIPQYLSSSFYDKRVFLISDKRAWARLRTRLHRAGIREVLVVDAWRPRRRERPLGEGVLRDNGLNYLSVELRRTKLLRYGRSRLEGKQTSDGGRLTRYPG